MPLSVLRLEDRILFDAAAPAVIAQVVADASGQGHEAGESHQASDANTADPHTADTHSLAVPDNPQAPPPTPATTDSQVSVLVVASNVDNAQQLANAAKQNVITVVYDYNQTSLSQLQDMINEALNGKHADTISFATEGQSGLFYLLKDVNVTADTLRSSSDLTSFWKGVGDMLTDTGRVDLLGCFVAGSQGNDFGLLSMLDHAIDSNGKDHSVAASNDSTGNAGNWILESGNVDASSYFNMDVLAHWNSTLATFTVTNLLNTGLGSLRQAITDANASVDPTDTIAFNLDVSTAQVITITTVLPTLGTGITIDGTTATNYAFGSRMVEVHFNNIAGLTIAAAASSEVRGLQFSGSNGAAITMSTGSSIIGNSGGNTDRGNIIFSNGTGISITGGTHTIHGNRIGTDISGTIDLGNTANGITITSGTGHLIGGTAAGEANLISGNNGIGLSISSTANAIIKGNLIGTDISGTSAVANGTGITLSGTGGITIGGTTAAERNIISGNTTNGISITAGTHSVTGNYIGTDINGTADLGNITNGISISGGTNHIIGGTTDGERNIISGNDSNGIAISGSATAIISGNYIGTDKDGESPIANNEGITINSSGTSTVGGATLAEKNVISGNTTNGVSLTRGTQHIYGNYIGTDKDGTDPLSNGTNGIAVSGGANQVIGGSIAGQGNLISGNLLSGITVTGASIEAFIKGNNIGTDKDGLYAIANGAGVIISGTGASIIGGTSATERNIIAGNATNIQLTAGTQSVTGNYIGTDKTGNVLIPGTSINISVTGGSNQAIGGILPGQSNYINGATSEGINSTAGSA